MVNIPSKAPYLHKEAKEMAAKMASHIFSGSWQVM